MGEVLLGLFLFAGLAVMLAAGATLVALHTPIDYTASIVAMAVLTTAINSLGPRGLAAVNRWLVPYLVCAVLAVTAFVLSGRPNPQNLLAGPLAGPGPSGLCALMLYVGYNFITGMAVLASLPPAVSRDRSTGALLAGVALGLMLACATIAIALHAPNVGREPLPLLSMAREGGPALSVAYLSALAAAILTTAVADAYALSRRLAPARPGIAGAAVVALAIPVANQGFVTLVDRAYPLLGAVGLVFLGLTLWRIARSKSTLA